jgi:hypothetical protein
VLGPCGAGNLLRPSLDWDWASAWASRWPS